MLVSAKSKGCMMSGQIGANPAPGMNVLVTTGRTIQLFESGAASRGRSLRFGAPGSMHRYRPQGYKSLLLPSALGLRDRSATCLSPPSYFSSSAAPTGSPLLWDLCFQVDLMLERHLLAIVFAALALQWNVKCAPVSAFHRH
jgi:hypothetical protein